MSTQNIITLDNLPTDKAVAELFAESSVDLLKYLRFDIGCVNHKNLRENLRLERLVCNPFCYVSDEEDKKIREAVIRKAISKIYEI